MLASDRLHRSHVQGVVKLVADNCVSIKHRAGHEHGSAGSHIGVGEPTSRKPRLAKYSDQFSPQKKECDRSSRADLIIDLRLTSG